MRRKKHKNTRRTLRFYRIQFGHRPPYKVLLDGNFAHALEAMKKGESKDLIERLLGDTVKCYTTHCVQRELKKLGKEYAGARQLLKRYPLHKCGHDEEHCSAADCLAAQLGDKNEEHFFVATQDKVLHRRCMSVPGGAVLFASINGVHLETPSALQKQRVKLEEQRNLLPSQAELHSVALQVDGAAQQQPTTERPSFRRKKAKGPNPLSLLPKKRKEPAAAVREAGSGKQQQQQQPAQAAQPKLQQQQQPAKQPQQPQQQQAHKDGEQQQGVKRKRQRRLGKIGRAHV